MLKHIFNVILLYTKNLSVTVHHCKKAYLFYVEFIGQIGNDNHSYLQLNSKDAMLFVYKKTIFDINNEYRKQYQLNDNIEKNLFEYINKFSTVYIEILEFVIDNDNMKLESKMSYIIYIQKMSNKIINKIMVSNKNILCKIEICISPLVMAEEMNAKFGVSPFIIEPMAIKPSYFFIFLATTTGISNAPDTSIVLKEIFLFFNSAAALCNNFNVSLYFDLTIQIFIFIFI